MVNVKTQVVSTLQSAGLPVYYELIADSSYEKPCITYRVTNDYELHKGDDLAYSRVTFQIKLWSDDVATASVTFGTIDTLMSSIGFHRTSYNELTMNNDLVCIATYSGLGQEKN